MKKMLTSALALSFFAVIGCGEAPKKPAEPKKTDPPASTDPKDKTPAPK